MGSPAFPSWGDQRLERWLARLADEGYRIGLRERLLLNVLLPRLARRGELPDDFSACLRLLAPLLCRSPDQQRRYAELVDGEAREHGAGDAETAGALAGLAAASGGSLVRILLVLVAVLALVAALTYPYWRSEPKPEAKPPVARVKQAIEVDKGDSLPPSPEAQPAIYLPRQLFPIPAEVVPAWASSARSLLAALGLLSLALLAWRVRRWRQRQLFVEHVHSQDLVCEKVLSDPDPPRLGHPPAVLAPLSRALRQRVSGQRQTLDVAATLRATIRQGGALAPRFRTHGRSPEYLALIETVGSGDLQAELHEAFVRALIKRGVGMEVYFFAHSPQRGCWRLKGADRFGYRRPYDETSFANLSERFGGQRLLVFGDAGAIRDPYTGALLDWLGHIPAFAERIWFTALPIGDWRQAEDYLSDPHGPDFLLLPMAREALDTLAAWLGSGRARLVSHARAPLAYPPMLRGEEAAWAGRAVAPPPERLEQLLYQLRCYLGTDGLLWLAACAIFPALSWPLTLALGPLCITKGEGKDKDKDGGRLAILATALAALPWFRYGRLPDWLRHALLDRLNQDQALATELRSVLMARLDAAVGETKGEAIANLARGAPLPERLRAWLAGQSGLARDLLLARFLEPGLAPKLAQRLPDWIRRLLFRNGVTLHGLRLWVESLVLLLLLASALALPGVWEHTDWAKPQAGVLPFVDLGTPAAPTATDQSVLALSPDGRRALLNGPDHSLVVVELASGKPVAQIPLGPTGELGDALFNADGRHVITASREGRLNLWNAVTGVQVGAPWQAPADAPQPNGEDLHLALAANGTQIILAGHGAVQTWYAASGALVEAHAYSPLKPFSRIALAADGTQLALAYTDASVQVQEFALPRLTPVGPAHSLAPWVSTSLAYDPSGDRLAVAGDGTASTAGLSLFASGAATPATWTDTGGPAITQLAFNPSGSLLLHADTAGSLRLRQASDGKAVGRAEFIKGQIPTPAQTLSRLAFLPDGSRFLSLDSAGGLRVWAAAAAPQAVDLLTCATPKPQGVDDPTRTLADALTAKPAAPASNDAKPAATTSPTYAPVAYHAALWQQLHPVLEQPKAGEILHRSADQAAAEALRARLAVLRPAGADQARWTLRAVAADLPALLVSACAAKPPPPPPDQLAAYPWQAEPLDQATDLKRQVDGLFDPRRTARPAALASLIDGAESVSDALPLAVQRALSIETGAPAGVSDGRSRTVLTLQLARAALPVSLQRHAEAIYRLIRAAEDNGSLAGGEIDALSAHLLAARGKTPILNLQIAREDQRPLARKLAAEFQKAGLRVRGVELRADTSPEQTELRIQGRSDRPLARWIAARAGAAGLPARPVSLVKENPEVDSYELWLGKAESQGPTVGERFRDCPDGSCPWLRVLPAGSFMMGSPAGEEGRYDDESPQHRVTISAPFAVMEAEVMREDFARFVTDTGYKQKAGRCDWDKPGIEQTAAHPMVCVSWEDATAFGKWMSTRTGAEYRLLSEAEWEYAARAGSTTRFHFGNDAKDLCRYAKVDGCDEYYKATAPVKSFQPNAFGLYDMHGNAWEWVQDCWHGNYKGAPSDGKSWEKDCSENIRVLRGGGWDFTPVNARSANRNGDEPVNRVNDAGFRLARTLKSSSFKPLPLETRK